MHHYRFRIGGNGPVKSGWRPQRVQTNVPSINRVQRDHAGNSGLTNILEKANEPTILVQERFFVLHVHDSRAQRYHGRSRF
jgi:hypothetical protein